jgi:transcriptional regulator of arginine metabolism
MGTKLQRQMAILDLVRSDRVTSQEGLRKLLLTRGFDVAQGTLSRDIKELGLIKAPDPDGVDTYTVPPDVVDPTPTLSRLMPALFVDAEGVDNLLVLRTLTGGAQPLAVGIDHEEWDEVLGTIAGDDTVLLILRHRKHLSAVIQRLRHLARTE